MIHALADIAGGNAVVQLDPSSKRAAQWVKFFVVGSGTVRVGNVDDTTSTRGFPVTASLPLELPYKGTYPTLNPYPMAGLYAYIPTGTTLSVLYDA